MEILLKLWNF